MCGPATCSPAAYRACMIVTCSLATRMLISRFSRRRISSPPLIGTVRASEKRRDPLRWILFSSTARRLARLVLRLVAIEVVPAGRVPGGVVRAGLAREADRLGDGGAATDRVPALSLRRPKPDSEDALLRRRGGPERNEFPAQSGQLIEALGLA